MPKEREFRGSRFRCLLATHQSHGHVIEFLNALVQPAASVGSDHRYAPEGFCKPDEAKIGVGNAFLNDKQNAAVTSWWLAKGSNIPNWDIISTCKIGNSRGLVLVEAKAHANELGQNDSCGATDEFNRQQISSAIDEANKSLGEAWSLSPGPRYQLSNRFAWAWKIARAARLCS